VPATAPAVAPHTSAMAARSRAPSS
jgi:hypothetical protein